MKGQRGLLSALLVLSGWAQAVELMKWERFPLPVPLNVGQERIVFVDKNVRVGFPPALNGKLRVQSSGGAVYLSASEAFPLTRLQLQNKENGELILLDVSADAGTTPREPVRLVYEGEVSSATPSNKTRVSGQDGNEEEGVENSAVTPRKRPQLTAPLPVVLTRYAAQSLYGPLRTVEPVPGITAVSLKLPTRITSLFPTEPVVVTLLAGWRLSGYSVAALQVRNTAVRHVVLDPRGLRGQFVSAAFQHRWLGKAGTPEDTTVLYLVIKGRPEGAFLPEPAAVKSEKGAR